MVDYIWIAVALPLLGSALLMLFGKRIGEPRAGYLATLLAAGSFVVVVIAAVDFFAGGHEGRLVFMFDWIPGLGIKAEFLWDPLSAVMTMVVAGVGSLIHLYSIGYMHEDEGYPRYFAYLNLFLASMLILVLGANFAILFIGWELVGLCSYLLISFWFEKPSAAAAGKKAFIVNRIGDFGFIVALMLIFATFGSLGFDTVFARAGALLDSGGVTVTAITLLLLLGAAGKSAQLPLYVWLPDAMEGPTPVSALIHAATMVTAGVYMVARTGVLFQLAPFSAGVVATVGAVTALYAATIAIAQKDIKRVLAYSTISQLGYMFMGVGVAAYTAGIFHLMTHAFFKALLFLGAGSVIHALSGEQDMDKMGGLRKVMPTTFITMAAASLAIAGIFPFAGFWSKDEILGATFNKGGYFVVLWAIGLVTAGLTAYYMSRLMFRTFYGESRWEEGAHPHESPTSMAVPLIVLGVLSTIGGLINTPWRLSLEHFLDPAFEGVSLAQTPSGATPWILAIASLAAAGVGVYVAYRRFLVGEAPEETGGVWDTIFHGYYVDDLYGKTLVLPGKAAANQMAFTADAKGIDGAVNGVGGLVKRLAAAAKPLQTGFMRNYGVGILGGAVALVLIMLVRGW
jgi:NADH-quinone oxidoreductase subunit L